MELLFIIALLSLATLICLFAKKRSVIELVSTGVAAIVFVLSIIIALKVSTLGVYASFSIFSVDALGAIIMLIIALVGLAASFYSVFYLREETTKQILGFRRVKQYFILMNLFLGVMFFAVTTNNPVLAWIAIEATTLSTAFLISFYNKPSAMEAAWKYLIINSVGLLLGFLGTLLYFTSVQSSGGGGLVSWSDLLSSASRFNPFIAKIAFVFVLIGYGTKVGFFPMHTWLPDAHSKAPAPISALLSGVLLNVALVMVLRFKLITDATLGAEFSQNLLLLFGVFSVVIAAFIIFTQKNYKRLLAYSSIENMGVIALGFGFGGLGVLAAVFHMIYHSLVKSALFLSAGNVFLKYSSTKIAKIKSAISVIPFTGVLFLIGFFAITGTPPLGLFLTKMYILSAGMQAHPFITLLILFSFVILFVGFFKHVTAMMFGEKPTEIVTGEVNRWLIISPFVLIAFVLYLSFHTPLFLQTLVNAVVAKY